jgi:hypothetical protein
MGIAGDKPREEWNQIPKVSKDVPEKTVPVMQDGHTNWPISENWKIISAATGWPQGEV